MEVSTFEAKNRLSALLAEVERGVEVTITRRGVPVAKLVPAGPGFDRPRARRAANGLRETSRGVTLGGVRLKDLVDEGHKHHVSATRGQKTATKAQMQAPPDLPPSYAATGFTASVRASHTRYSTRQVPHQIRLIQRTDSGILLKAVTAEGRPPRHRLSGAIPAPSPSAADGDRATEQAL